MSNDLESKLSGTLWTYRIPEHLHGGILRYVLHGYRPGDFLWALITNNLSQACARADEESAAAFVDIVRWFYNQAPWQCWGSPEKAAAWVQEHAEKRKRAREATEAK